MLIIELKAGIRQLLRTRGFSLMVVTALGLSIGCTLAVISIVRATLLQPGTYRDPASVVMLWAQTQAGAARMPFSPPDMLDIQQMARTLSGVAAVNSFSASLVHEPGQPEQIQLGVTTGNFFDLLGVAAAAGRTYGPADDTSLDTRDPNNTSVVVLTHALWTRRFGADPAVLGEMVRIGGSSMEVIGILPPSFELRVPPDAGMATDLAAYTPLRIPYATAPRQGSYLKLIGRLAPGETVASATAELEVIERELRARFPHHEQAGLQLRVGALDDEAVRHTRPILAALTGAVALFLIIACVNLANLMLVRLSARGSELAVRSALGASRLRLLRQLLIESVLLAGVGAALGLMLSALLVRVGITLVPDALTHLRATGVDAHTLLTTVGLAAGTLVLVGLLPALLMLRPDLAARLRERAGTGTAQRRALRAGLMTAEIAFSVVLLAGALLLVRSTARFADADLGFSPERIVTFRIALPFAQYRGPAAWQQFYDRYTESLEALPAVSAVDVASWLPGSGSADPAPFALLSDAQDEFGVRRAAQHVVGPAFFEAVGIPLRAGRAFTAEDRAARPNVAIVDAVLAERLWPEQSPIGQQLVVSSSRFEQGYSVVQMTVEVIGVVGAVIDGRPGTVAPGAIYLPHAQHPQYVVAFAVRPRGSASDVTPALRTALNTLDPALPIYDVRTLDDVVQANVAPTRFALGVLGWFAVLSVLFTSFGLYAVVALAVRERRREFVLRMALGASPGVLMSNVLGGVLRIAALGVGIGMIGALLAAPTIAGLLIDTSPADAVAFTLAPLIGLLLPLFACALPARRAAKVSPREALGD